MTALERWRDLLPGWGIPQGDSGAAARIVGVDTSEDVLAAFREAANAVGIEAATVSGTWPDVAPSVELVDVAVCDHVLYNVRDLEPFARALDAHVRLRVVVEITATHPLAWMADLWTTFHGLERPDGPDAGDALEALRELGFDAHRDDASRPPRAGGFEDRADAVALIRRRLCLSADRDDEVAEALGSRLIERDGLWSAGPAEQTVVTLWWDRSS